LTLATERALASKGIDLIAPGIRPSTLEKTRDELKQIAAQTPTYDHLVGEYAGRTYPVSHIYLKHMSGPPRQETSRRGQVWQGQWIHL